MYALPVGSYVSFDIGPSVTKKIREKYFFARIKDSGEGQIQKEGENVPNRSHATAVRRKDRRRLHTSTRVKEIDSWVYQHKYKTN